jgi:hypothetical protein
MLHIKLLDFMAMTIFKITRCPTTQKCNYSVLMRFYSCYGYSQCIPRPEHMLMCLLFSFLCITLELYWYITICSVIGGQGPVQMEAMELGMNYF